MMQIRKIKSWKEIVGDTDGQACTNQMPSVWQTSR